MNPCVCLLETSAVPTEGLWAWTLLGVLVLQSWLLNEIMLQTSGLFSLRCSSTNLVTVSLVLGRSLSLMVNADSFSSGCSSSVHNRSLRLSVGKDAPVNSSPLGTGMIVPPVDREYWEAGN